VGKSLGKYAIKEVLGIGGMGIVFKALHEALNKTVAIKIFVPATDDVSFEKRFLREARILAGLKHPNIIEVYDFDISQWGMPFYVMEYLEGKTLGEIIRGTPKGLSMDRVSYYLLPIIRGLHHAHRKGIVHRDLKPDNIFIETVHDQEVLKILDFGIAKSMVADDATANLTGTETVLGTPYYLTPEQILNKNIGPHTDQYALALITGEMLSGQVLRGGKSVGEILYKEVHNPIELDALKRKKIPAPVAEVLVKATTPKPAKRYPDIETFGRALTGAMNSAAPGAPETLVQTVASAPGSGRKTFLSIEEEARLDIRKKKIKRIAIAAVMFAVVAAIVLWFIFVMPKQMEEKPKPPVTRKTKPVAAKMKTFEPARTIAVDAVGDESAILTFQGDTIVLKGSNHVYLVDKNGAAKPESREVQGRIVAGLPGGGIAQRADYYITISNFIDVSDHVLINNPPRGHRYRLSPSQSFLAVKKGSKLTLYRLTNKTAKTIKSFETEDVSGFFMELGIKYFAFLDNSRLRVFLLEGEPVKEVFTPPFEQPIETVKALAIHDNGGLLAIGGRFDDVYIYSLNNGGRRIIKTTGFTFALAFRPDSPTLLIAQEEKLLEWTPGKKGITASYKTPGAAVTSILASDDQLFALDKNTRKLFVF
jgi:serine/threonine protein kinase